MMKPVEPEERKVLNRQYLYRSDTGSSREAG
jgi:hypothetical protein